MGAGARVCVCARYAKFAQPSFLIAHRFHCRLSSSTQNYYSPSSFPFLVCHIYLFAYAASVGDESRPFVIDFFPHFALVTMDIRIAGQGGAAARGHQINGCAAASCPMRRPWRRRGRRRKRRRAATTAAASRVCVVLMIGFGLRFRCARPHGWGQQAKASVVPPPSITARRSPAPWRAVGFRV